MFAEKKQLFEDWIYIAADKIIMSVQKDIARANDQLQTLQKEKNKKI